MSWILLLLAITMDEKQRNYKLVNKISLALIHNFGSSSSQIANKGEFLWGSGKMVNQVKAVVALTERKWSKDGCHGYHIEAPKWTRSKTSVDLLLEDIKSLIFWFFSLLSCQAHTGRYSGSPSWWVGSLWWFWNCIISDFWLGLTSFTEMNLL